MGAKIRISFETGKADDDLRGGAAIMQGQGMPCPCCPEQVMPPGIRQHENQFK